MDTLRQLSTLLLDERDAILLRWRSQVRTLPSAQALDLPTLTDHIPGWIVNLSASLLTLAEAEESVFAVESPPAHGAQRFEDGFDIEEVVAEYNILRDCVYELAEQRGLELRGRGRRVVDLAFDTAIGGAVKAFAEGQAREVQRRRAEHLAFVAHDLRTPLSAIAFSAQVLELRLPVAGRDPETVRLLKILGRNVLQLDTLVTRVLKENTQLLTELGVKLERRVFDLWPVVESLIQEMQPIAAKAGTSIVNEVPDDLSVNADAGLLRRILQNLVANAISYTPHGQVTVGARDLGPEAPVECWVMDNGAGIAPDRLGKVFEPLETDPERDGVGLGLAIVKTFVEGHEGEVTVESVVGQGSIFRFTLPRREAAPAPALERPAAMAASASKASVA